MQNVPNGTSQSSGISFGDLAYAVLKNYRFCPVFREVYGYGREPARHPFRHDSRKALTAAGDDQDFSARENLSLRRIIHESQKVNAGRMPARLGAGL